MKGYRYETLSKMEARKVVIEAYRRHTGRRNLPKEGSYWTLCARQTRAVSSEVMQLCDAGLISVEQYNGVDKDPVIIEANKKNYPRAQWHAADWAQVICRPEFKPTLVFLDSTWQIGGFRRAGEWRELRYPKLAKLAARTLRVCSPGTIVVVNGILSNTWQRGTKEERKEDTERRPQFHRKVFQSNPDLLDQGWEAEQSYYVNGSSLYTTMAMYVFYRKGGQA